MAVLVILVAFLLRAAYMGGLGTVASYAMGVILSPLQKVSAEISNSVTNVLDTFLKADEYKRENEELRERINELNQQLIDYETYKRENEQYKQFLEIKEKNKDFQFELASVLGRSPDDRFYSFTIDRGSADGVELWDPVITAEGLVGYISQINPTYSQVRTILDPTVRVGCQAIRTRDTGIITGTVDFAEDGFCKLTYIDRDSPISRGDMIVTSGVGGRFPQGLVVGIVEEVAMEPNGVSLFAKVKPESEIKNVKDVLVIKSFAGQETKQEGEDEPTDGGEGEESDPSSQEPPER